MSLPARLSVSLLVSTIVFAGFSVVSFTGLFPWLEAQVYSPRVVSFFQTELKAKQSSLVEWQSVVEKKLLAFIDSKVLGGVFDPTQSRTALEHRYQSTRLFLEAFGPGATLRVTDATLDRLHFSSSEADVLAKGQFSLTYKRVGDLDDAQFLQRLRNEGQTSGTTVLWDSDTQTFLFSQKWVDPVSDESGLVLLTLGLNDADNRLFLQKQLAFGEQFLMAKSGYPVFFVAGRPDVQLGIQIAKLADRGVWPTVQRLADSADGHLWILISVPRSGSGLFGHPSLVVPESRLAISPILEMIILVSFYSVCFLVVFLVLNWRGDPLSAVSRKVKRFQIQVVKQYLDQKEAEKNRELRPLLERHSAQIKLDIRKSLGRLRHQDEMWVNDYIDRSWQEILSLLGARGVKEDLVAPNSDRVELDWVKLESLLRKVVTGVSAQSSNETLSSGRGAGKAAGVIKKQNRHDDSSEVEELEDADDGEAVEELEDADQAEEVEVLDEVEEVEELEDADDGEAVEELEDADQAEEVEVLDQTDEVEELEDADDGEAVEELEDADQAEEVEVLAAADGPLVDKPFEGLQVLEESADDQIEILEELASDSSGTASLEEMEGQDGTLELFASGRTGHDAPAFGPSSLEELEVDAQDQDIGELVPLTDNMLPSTENEMAPQPLTTFSFDQLDATWDNVGSGIFDQDGDVVRLADGVFQSAQTANDDLSRLVDGVLNRTPVAVVDDDIPKQNLWPWVWTGGGFDLDRFFGPNGRSSLMIYRGLTVLASELGGFSAAFLEHHDGVWVAVASVGFSDQGKQRMNYAQTSLLAQSCLNVRGIHLLSGQHNRLVWESFHARDVHYLGAVALLPVLANGKPGWVLVGYKRYPTNLIELLRPRTLQ